jgi:hypothetical protein
MGIQGIEDVRILVLDKIPLPNDPELQQFAIKTGLITGETAGIAFGHGILLKNGSQVCRMSVDSVWIQYERSRDID